MDKIEVARRQLGTALSLYLDDHDPVSVQVLASAGMEIAHHLSVKASAHPFKLFRQAEAPSITDAEYGSIRGYFANAFKHAVKPNGVERDDTGILAEFSDLQNDDRLFIGWFDFGCAGHPHPIESHVFQAWYMAMHPARLASAAGQELLRDLDLQFPGLSELPRMKQKAMLKWMIERAKRSRRFTADPRVDPRPLQLGPIQNDG